MKVKRLADIGLGTLQLADCTTLLSFYNPDSNNLIYTTFSASYQDSPAKEHHVQKLPLNW